MNITKRSYTYPVLSEETDDYTDSKFDVEVGYQMISVNTLSLNFDINMSNDELKKMFSSGEAEYVIHIECPNTSFRTTVHSIANKINKEILIERVKGRLEILILIVTKKDISNFINSKWQEDYQGLSFELPKGSILAYKNTQALEIAKHYEELNNASSIFKVYKRNTDEPKPLEVDLSDSQIGIGLGTEDYKIYSRFCDKETFQPILNTMLIFPALVYVFEELKQEEEFGNYESRHWYISLSRAYDKRGVSLKDELINAEKTSVQLAQEAMELPINMALRKLVDLFENVDEEEEA